MTLKLLRRSSRILIVEDDVGIREGLQTLFETSDIEAHWAKNGDEARRTVKAHGNTLQLLLVDRQLPDVDGLALIPELKPSLCPQAKIYLFSADYARSNGLETGVCDGLIRKPFDIDELMDLAEKYA